jgi:hypothetical protein
VTFHAVGVEHQVIAHPDRIEAELFGQLGALDQPLARCLLAEVGQ